jgi:alkane 1-monooxygenase
LILAVGGARALGIHLVTAFLARGIVALVNYVQHYGLARRPGEKAGIDHAWDLPFKSGNLIYFNAGLHADHHVKASLVPGDLTYRATRFALPMNIQFILPLALVPPLFFRVMNPLLDRTRVSRPSTQEAPAEALLPDAFAVVRSQTFAAAKSEVVVRVA